jgi:hypothetical protein
LLPLLGLFPAHVGAALRRAVVFDYAALLRDFSKVRESLQTRFLVIRICNCPHCSELTDKLLLDAHTGIAARV